LALDIDGLDGKPVCFQRLSQHRGELIARIHFLIHEERPHLLLARFLHARIYQRADEAETLSQIRRQPDCRFFLHNRRQNADRMH
jgi:hypothetical protein